MPALPLPGHPPALIAHVLFPLQAAVATSLQPEDFLLIESCVVSMDRKKERKVNPSTGQCYALIYFDPELSFRITARVTGAFGLANYHPGKRVNQPTLPACANVGPAFGVETAGKHHIYESPQLTRGRGTLPTISFTIAVEGGTLDEAQLVVPAVAAVTAISWPPAGAPPAGARYDLIYNTVAVWIRKLNLTGPVTGIVYFTNERVWSTAPARAVRPATLAAFLVQPYVGPEATGENVVEEVVTLGPAGITVLRAGASVISPVLTAGEPIGPRLPYQFYWGGTYHPAGGGTPYAIMQSSNVANVPAGISIADWVLLAQRPGDATGYVGLVEVTEVYDVARAEWL